MSTLRFGLLGLGRFGQHYARLLQDMPGVELAAVATRSSETLQRSTDLPAAVLKTTDVGEIMRDISIDCVVIATPPSTHVSLAKAALEAGKHVMLEKPMATNIDEARAVRDHVRKSRQTFMVGHQYVYNEYIQHLHEQIRQEKFGKIKCVIWNHLYSGLMRNDVGCFRDAGTHALSVLHYLFDPWNIVTVQASGVDVYKPGRDDYATATITFEHGLRANITTSWLVPERVRTLTVIGEKGQALFDDIATQAKLKYFCQSRGPAPQNTPRVIPSVTAHEPLRNELEHFVQCVRTGETPLTGIANSYGIEQWLDVIYHQMTSQ